MSTNTARPNPLHPVTDEEELAELVVVFDIDDRADRDALLAVAAVQQVAATLRLAEATEAHAAATERVAAALSRVAEAAELSGALDAMHEALER